MNSLQVIAQTSSVSALILVFLGFCVDVSEDVDIREVDPEPAQQRGHSENGKPRGE